MKNPEIIDGKYLSQIGHINHTGEVQYTIAQLLQKDFAQIQQDTNGGRADIYIINLIPGKKIKGPALLKGDVCVWIPEKQLDKYKKLGLKELEVCYNLEARTVEGKLRVAPKFLKGGNIGGSFVAGPMGLRDIAISGEELGIQLGTSPAQLQKIGASVNDLHLNPGWFIHGDLGISVGRKKIANQQFKPINNHKNGAISTVQMYKIIYKNPKETIFRIDTSVFNLARIKKTNVVDNKRFILF